MLDLGQRDNKPQSLTAANAQNAPNICCPLRSHPTREEAGKHGPYPTKSSQQKHTSKDNDGIH